MKEYVAREGTVGNGEQSLKARGMSWQQRMGSRAQLEKPVFVGGREGGKRDKDARVDL